MKMEILGVVQQQNARLGRGRYQGQHLALRFVLGVVHQQNARLGSGRHQGRHLALRYARLAKIAMQWIANPRSDSASLSSRSTYGASVPFKWSEKDCGASDGMPRKSRCFSLVWSNWKRQLIQNQFGVSSNLTTSTPG